MDSRFFDPESRLRDYNLSRWMGNGPDTHFDFKALEKTLDCTRSFNQCGIIFNDGKRELFS